MKINDILKILDSIAPFCTAEEWDNSGLLIGDADSEIKKIGIVLDITNETVDYAINNSIDLIISHHPVIFHPLANIDSSSPVYRMIANGISAIACHTNFDKTGRLNKALAERLDLEYICDIEGGWGIICALAIETDVEVFAQQVKEKIGATGLSYGGNRKIKKIAISTGSAFEDVYSALLQGADGIITSDVKHNGFIDAVNMNFSVISADHYDTEKLFCEELYALLKDTVKDTQLEIITQESAQKHI